MSRLLLVEDDDSLGATLQERLVRKGHEVKWVQRAQLARKAVEQSSFDLIIFDVGLPDGNGFELAKEISITNKTPFLFVTAQTTAEDRLQGFEIGAEEYIPKPFHLKEFLLRVEHVLKNHLESHVSASASLSPQTDLVTVLVDGVVIDWGAMTVQRRGESQKQFIATKDFLVLKLLFDQAPRVVSRDEILDGVWGETQFPSNRTVDNVIVRLRQILGEMNAKKIRSVRGVGYQWVGDGDE